MSSPQRKKQKYDYEPAVVSGARSASEVAKGEGSDAAFFFRGATLEEFFPPDKSGSDAKILIDAKSEKFGIKNPKLMFAYNENGYRNAIYRQLTDNEKGNLKTAQGTYRRNSYKEIDLIRLFEAFLEENTSDGNGESDGTPGGINSEEKEALISSLRQKEHGLKITTTSWPDLSFLRHSNSVVEFVLGEVKHASKYTREHAQQQAACYLQALLYFLRVKIGLPVTAVHGFTVCGSKCSEIRSTFTEPKYAIGFVKVVAPRTFGCRFDVSSYWNIFEVGNPAGLELLTYFLKHGKSFEYETLPVPWESRRAIENRCPSLFTTPPKLWKDTDTRTLVVNGTLAAVFQVSSLDSAKMLLDMVWQGTIEGKKKKEASMSLQTIKWDEIDFVYVKIHTAETVKNLLALTFHDIWLTLNETRETYDDFFKTYFMMPPSFHRCSFIVMNDRGVSLNRVKLSDHFETFSEARSRLEVLKSNVDKLGQICFHADVLPHNVAVDNDGNLTLFDYDEAVELDGYAPKRVIADEENAISVLSYPNALLQSHKLHSAVQFSLIVRFVAEALGCTELSDLRSIHDDLAVALREETMGEVSSQTLKIVERLVACVNSMLQESVSSEAIC